MEYQTALFVINWAAIGGMAYIIADTLADILRRA